MFVLFQVDYLKMNFSYVFFIFLGGSYFVAGQTRGVW